MSSLATVHSTTNLLAVESTKVTPGILGFVVFAALGIGTWWILKAMNGSLRRINFVEEPEEPKAATTSQDTL